MIEFVNTYNRNMLNGFIILCISNSFHYYLGQIFKNCGTIMDPKISVEIRTRYLFIHVDILNLQKSDESQLNQHHHCFRHRHYRY